MRFKTNIFHLQNVFYIFNQLNRRVNGVIEDVHLRAFSTVFHNNNPFIEFSNFLTSVVEFNGEFENKKKK